MRFTAKGSQRPHSGVTMRLRPPAAWPRQRAANHRLVESPNLGLIHQQRNCHPRDLLAHGRSPAGDDAVLPARRRPITLEASDLQ